MHNLATDDPAHALASVLPPVALLMPACVVALATVLHKGALPRSALAMELGLPSIPTHGFLS